MKQIINFFIAIKANITLWYASKQAERAYNGSHRVGTNRDGSVRYNRRNCRFYVMPDANHRLICMSRQEFHKLRTKLYMSPEAKIKHLNEESFYYTHHANGTEGLTPAQRDFKRKKFIEYSIVTYHQARAYRKQEKEIRKKLKHAHKVKIEKRNS
jgi:hypothetical protein